MNVYDSKDDIGCKSCKYFVMPKEEWWGCKADTSVPGYTISKTPLIEFKTGAYCYMYQYKGKDVA